MAARCRVLAGSIIDPKSTVLRFFKLFRCATPALVNLVAIRTKYNSSRLGELADRGQAGVGEGRLVGAPEGEAFEVRQAFQVADMLVRQSRPIAPQANSVPLKRGRFANSANPGPPMRPIRDPSDRRLGDWPRYLSPASPVAVQRSTYSSADRLLQYGQPGVADPGLCEFQGPERPQVAEVLHPLVRHPRPVQAEHLQARQARQRLDDALIGVGPFAEGADEKHAQVVRLESRTIRSSPPDRQNTGPAGWDARVPTAWV